MANILCVDDSEVGLLVRQLLLQACGHTVVTAMTGAQAIAMSKLAIFDLVVTDYFLEDMNGSELSQILKRSCRDLKILMLSGSCECEGASDEVDCFVLKGGDPSYLIKAVDELLDLQSRALSAAG